MGRLDKLKRQAVNEANQRVLGEQDDDSNNITRAFTAHSSYNTHRKYFNLLDKCCKYNQISDLITNLKNWDATDTDQIKGIGHWQKDSIEKMVKVNYKFIEENPDPCILWCL